MAKEPKKEKKQKMVETRQSVFWLKFKSYAIKYFIQYYQIIILVFIVAILFFGVMFLIIPKINQIQDQRQVVLPSKQKLVDLKMDYLNSLRESEIDYNEIGSSVVDKVFDALPTNIDKPSLMVELEQITQRNNAKMLAIDISEEDYEVIEPESEQLKDILSQDSTIKVVKISLSLQGTDYNHMKDLLQDIEYNLRIMDIESIKFSPDFENIAINLRTYYLLEN